MNRKTFWNKALILSVFFHLGVLPCLGIILNNCLSAHSQPEKIIELELIRSVSAKSSDNGAAGQMSETSQPQKAEQKPPVNNSYFTENKIEPIAKNNQAVIDRTAQSITENSDKRTGKQNSDNNISGNPGNPAGAADLNGSGSPAGSDGGQSGNGGGYIRPRLLNKIEPVYPEKARAAAREGTVSVSLEVLSNGQVGSVTIKQSSGHADLDDAAVKAVKRWRFVPAKNGVSGQPITCLVNFPVVFQIKS